MHITLTSMKRAFPRLNIESYTFEDVERLCKKHHIKLSVCDYDPDILGYFCTRRTPKGAKKFIVLNSKLDQIGRTFTGLHELAHYFLHVPASARQWFYCRRNAERTQSKQDCEANSFALVAMIPQSLMIELAAADTRDIHPALAELCVRRKKLWEEYRI
jgi:hypothetical protein